MGLGPGRPGHGEAVASGRNRLGESATASRSRPPAQSAGQPWENGSIESFNGKLRDELLNLEIFDTLYEAKVLIERWRCEYNHIHPHSSPGYRPPAPEAILPLTELRVN